MLPPFIPRALRLKGIKESQTRKSKQVEPLPTPDLVGAAPAPQQDCRVSQIDSAPAKQGYIAQLAAGVDLIFTDYAHQAPDSAKWLGDRYRTVDSEEKYIHLAAILEHRNIATLNPAATQSLLRRAVKECCSDSIELSRDEFYIRRRPSTYPSSFVPTASFDIVDDDGLSFWDQRTIYVEPHIRHMCKTPAKVAHWLKDHGQLKKKWLPIQAVHSLHNSCAFVVVSGSVMHQDVWNKWRASEKPDDWKIMTKVENIKRTEEYVALLSKTRAEFKRRITSAKGAKGIVNDLKTDKLDRTTGGGFSRALHKEDRKRQGELPQEIDIEHTNSANESTVPRKRRKHDLQRD